VSWYREVYLQSEDWKNLRAAVLAIKAPDGRCNVCGKKRKLDVHHIEYRKLYDVPFAALIPICRKCHEEIHELIAEHPKWKKLCPWVRWRKFILPRLEHHLYFKRAQLQKKLTELKKQVSFLEEKIHDMDRKLDISEKGV